MRITPLDIRKQEFRKAMRGLDAEEVYAFLATVAEEYESALSDNKALRERVLELDDKVQEYRTMEKTLRDTLLTAERVTADAKDHARREGNLIIKEAQIEAEKVLRDIKNQAMRLRREIQELRRERENYFTRMKMLAESYLKFIEGEEKDFETADRRVEPLTEGDSAEEVKTKKSRVERPRMEPEGTPRAEQPHVAPPQKEPVEALQTELLQAAPPPLEPTVEAQTEPFQDAPPRLEPAEAPQTVQPQVAPAHEKPMDVTQAEQPQAGELRVDPAPETTMNEAVTREEDSQVPSSGTSIPDLNAILDRMVEEQKEMLRRDLGEETGTGSPSRAAETQGTSQPPYAEQKESTRGEPPPRESSRETSMQPPLPKQNSQGKEEESDWSLDKIRQDILSDPALRDEI